MANEIVDSEGEEVVAGPDGSSSAQATAEMKNDIAKLCKGLVQPHALRADSNAPERVRASTDSALFSFDVSSDDEDELALRLKQTRKPRNAPMVRRSATVATMQGDTRGHGSPSPGKRKRIEVSTSPESATSTEPKVQTKDTPLKGKPESSSVSENKDSLRKNAATKAATPEGQIVDVQVLDSNRTRKCTTKKKTSRSKTESDMDANLPPSSVLARKSMEPSQVTETPPSDEALLLSLKYSQPSHLKSTDTPAKPRKSSASSEECTSGERAALSNVSINASPTQAAVVTKLSKQPEPPQIRSPSRFRVGLSKRSRVEPLHPYLKRDDPKPV